MGVYSVNLSKTCGSRQVVHMSWKGGSRESELFLGVRWKEIECEKRKVSGISF